MLALTEFSELSRLEDEFESCRELALIAARFASMLDEEFDRLRLEVLLVDILAFTELSEASTLDDEVDKLFELVLRAPRSASTLEELLERLRLEI